MALPTLAAGVPTELRIEPTGDRLARLADALLADGALTSADWQGNLVDTVQAGLTRFVNAELRGNVLDGTDLAFYYTDDVAVNFHDLSATFYWTSHFGSRDKERGDRIGGFGLIGRDMGEILVGRRVAWLEEVFPGAGWAVLEVATTAVGAASAGVFGFRCAEAQAEVNGDGYLHGNLENSGVGFDVLRKHVPKEAFAERDWKTGGLEVLARAARSRKAAVRADSEFRALVTEALDLAHTLDAVPPWPNHLAVWGDIEFLPACLVRWCEDDGVRELCDDAMEYTTSQMAWSHWQWLAAWDWENPETITGAIDRLRYSLGVLARGYGLLTALHRDARLANALRVRTR